VGFGGKGYQHVNIALRVKVVPPGRTEDGKFGDLPAPAEGGEFIPGKVGKNASHISP
jgi:hypothetical protein